MTGIISHPVFSRHEMGPGHPESPRRLFSIEQALKELTDLKFFEPLSVSEDLLTQVHSQRLIDKVKASAPEDSYSQLDADTVMNEFTLEATMKAAGALVLAVDLVLDGKVKNCFCAVRPPGHHAERDKAMGFCFFNNVAVGASYALEQKGLKRVAIVDFDVHHGNGTEDIFAHDERVLFCSSFQFPHYPGYYNKDPRRWILNEPLNAFGESSEFRQAIEQKFVPALSEFKPELIFISAGFDAHQDDPLGNLNLQVEDFVWATEQIVQVANQVCEGKIISTLEGGYDLKALGQCVRHHIGALG